MPTVIAHATRIQAAGNKPKLIDEYVGRVNSKTESVSVAHMRSPQGWIEPGQTQNLKSLRWYSKAPFVCISRRVRWMSRPGRPSSPTRASGCGTPRLTREARNTLPFAYRLFPWKRFIATNNQ